MIILNVTFSDGQKKRAIFSEIPFHYISSKELDNIAEKINLDKLNEPGIHIAETRLDNIEDFYTDLRVLSSYGREILKDIINSLPFLADQEALSDQEVLVLNKYIKAKEFEKFVGLLSTSVDYLNQLDVSLEEYADPKLSERRDFLVPVVKKIFAILTKRNSVGKSDEIYVKFEKLGFFGSNEAESTAFVKGVSDFNRLSQKEQVEAIRIHKLGAKELSLSDLIELRDLIDSEEKRRIVLESELSEGVIASLEYADKKILNAAISSAFLGRAPFSQILKYYKPSKAEIESLLKVKESYSAMLDHGILSSEELTEEVIQKNPAFFLKIPWVISNPEKFKITISHSSDEDIVDAIGILLEKLSSESELFLIEKLRKPSLCEIYEKLSLEGKKTAKTKVFDGLAGKDVRFVIKYLGSELSDSEHSETVAKYSKTVNGALDILRELDDVTLRDSAIETLLKSDAQRKRIYNLDADFRLSDDEVSKISKIVIEQLKDEDLYFRHIKIHDRILLKNQKEFYLNIRAKLANHANNFSKCSDDFVRSVNHGVLVEMVTDSGAMTVFRLKDALGLESLAGVFFDAKVDLLEWPELLSEPEAIQKINNIKPLKNYRILEGKLESPQESLKVIKAEGINQDVQKLALNVLMKSSPNELSLADLTGCFYNLRQNLENRQVFQKWAKGNVAYVLSMIEEGYSDQVLLDESDIKKALILSTGSESKWGYRRIVHAACKRMPDYVIENIDRLSARHFTIEEIIEILLIENPRSVPTKLVKDNCGAKKSPPSLSALLLTKGSPDEKVTLIMELKGRSFSTFKGLLDSEDLRDYVLANADELILANNVALDDLTESAHELAILNKLVVADWRAFSNAKLEIVIENCSAHKESAELEFLSRVNESKVIFGGHNLMNLAVRKINDASLLRVTNIRVILSSDSLTDENREKVVGILSRIKAGESAIVRLSKLRGSINIEVLNNELLASRFNGIKSEREDVIIPELITKAFKISRKDKIIMSKGIVRVISGIPILELGSDSGPLLKSEGDVQAEINELVRSKKIIKKEEIKSISAERSWDFELSFSSSGKKRNITFNQLKGEDGVGSLVYAFGRMDEVDRIENLQINIDLSDVNSIEGVSAKIAESLGEISNAICTSGVFSEFNKVWGASGEVDSFNSSVNGEKLVLYFSGNFASAPSLINAIKSIISTVEGMVSAAKISAGASVDLDGIKEIMELSSDFAAMMDSEEILNSI